MSERQGIQDQDPAERLASALRRIAVSIERREAIAAATKAALDAVVQPSQGQPYSQPAEREPGQVTHTGARQSLESQSTSVPVLAANLDALIGRLRAVLDELPAGPLGTAPQEIQPAPDTAIGGHAGDGYDGGASLGESGDTPSGGAYSGGAHPDERSYADSREPWRGRPGAPDEGH